MDVSSRCTIFRKIGRSACAPGVSSGRNRAKIEAKPKTTHKVKAHHTTDVASTVMDVRKDCLLYP
jgi:hypothetical protein